MNTVTTALKTVINVFDRDVLVAAVTVIPATSVWIQTENIVLGSIAGFASYLAFEHGIPFVQTRKLDIRTLMSAYDTVRSAIATKIIKRI